VPELSVIVAAYNAAETIEACLSSIRRSLWREYELIVVDDGSRDGTLSLAERYADRVVRQEKNQGRFQARQSGMQEAQSSILVNVDSDVVVFPDTLRKIRDFFLSHPEAHAVTGLLSKEHPNPNFASQYKNLYMHYRFRGLPERVTFLYGSLFAIRKDWSSSFKPRVEIADDTAWGQELVRQGLRICLLRDLEVVHLKKYSFVSWLKNDFRIPYDWARIFWRYRGWRQIGRNRTGFAHASVAQIACLFLAPAFVLAALLAVLVSWALPVAVFSGFMWLVLNSRFFYFLAAQKGPLFLLEAVFATLLDHLVMGAGVLAGFLSCWAGRADSF
jgi:glycosyltransferase involved in cell wall biosynthesis